MADDISLVVGVDYTQLTGLIKTTDQTKRALGSISREFAKTGDQKQYMRGINQLVAAQKRLDVSSRLSRSQIMKLGAQMQQEVKFSQALTNATMGLSNAQMAATKSSNRMGVVTQQAGYQVSDFIVQVQSGTNAFVAFGQQASQLVGVLPLVASPLGLTAGAAVALSAGLGIAIPLVTAIGAAFTRSSGEAKSATRDLREELEELNTALSQVATGAEASISAGLTANLVDAQSKVNELINRLNSEEFKRAMSYAGASTASGQVTQTIVDAELEGRKGVVAELENQVRQAAILETQERVRKALIGDQVQEAKNLTDAQRLIRDAESERAEKAQEILDKVSQTLTLKGLEASLLKAELSYGKDSYEFRKISYDVEQARYRLELQNGNYTKGQIRDLIKANGEVLSLKYKISKQDQGAIDLVNTLNYQYSLVEDELKDITSEQKKLNDEAEKLGERLGIGFERALTIIRQAKAEATVGLDAFGGAGDFKYSVPTTFKPDKDKPKRTKIDPLAVLKKQLDVEQALIGKTEARQRIIRSLGVDFMKYGKDTIDSLEKQINKTIQLEEAERKRQQVLEEARQRQQEVADTIASSMENAMMSVIDGTKSVEAAFKNMASEIIKELYRIYVVKQITGMVSDAVGLFTGAPVGQVSMSANGNAFSNGNVVPYANGGVVGGPTYFPMAGGKTGLMGEAGPEAIMPLKRGKGGKLGVQVEGSTGDTVTVNQTINVSTGVQQTVRTEIKSLMPQIAESAKSAVMDAKRRGGSYGRSFA